MAANGVMTLILRYFTDFVYDVFVKQNYLGFKLLIAYTTILGLIRSAQLFSDYLGKTNNDNSV